MEGLVMQTATRNNVSSHDLIPAFLVGAAVSTGNPAVAELGLVGIILPVVIAIAVALFSSRQNFSSAALVRGFTWAAAAYIAFIFLWYEQYKLLGDSGSVELFTTLTNWAGFPGQEKVMRIGVGTCEIIASLFLLVPAVQGLGGIGALMLMSGAIFFHLVTPLGVDPYGDGGVLFKEACSVWISALAIIWWRRDQLAALARRVGLPVPAFAAA